MAHRLHLVLGVVEKSYIIIHEADKPNIVSHLTNTYILPGEWSAEIDLASAYTDSSALGDLYYPIVERVIRDVRVMEFSCGRCVQFRRIQTIQCSMRAAGVSMCHMI